MSSDPNSAGFRALDVAVVGGGLGGLSAAISLRRAGHRITIYERHDFAGEVGAGIGIPPNGYKWLDRWGVNLEAGKPVIMSKLIIHKWDTGEIIATAPLGNYKEKFGYDTAGFQRCDLHRILLSAALSEKGSGTPCKLVTRHLAIGVDSDLGKITFENGAEVAADLVVAADGIRSLLRLAIGISPDIKQASSCAYRMVIAMEKARELGLADIGSNDALEFWTSSGTDRVVIGSCHGGEVLGIYSFFPIDPEKKEVDGWDISTTPKQLLDTFPTLDPRIRQLMLHSEDIKIWRLYIHKPYPYWTRGRVALLGDAAHPMLPDQTQGHSQAIEDAAALGLVFSEKYFKPGAEKNAGAIEAALKRYEQVRMTRVGELQTASAKAREDMRERIGWAAEGVKPGKLTIEDLCGYDMERHLSDIVAAE